MTRKHIITLMLLTLCLTASAQTKTVSILGDSYSTFQGYLEPDTNYVWYFDGTPRTQTDVTSVTQTWWHQLITAKGWRLLKNNSFSGSTICNTGYRQEDVTRNSFLARMDNLGGAPDIIYIFGGTNDAWANSPIGEYKYQAWTKQDLYSFRPAMAYMLHHMTLRYLNTQIIFILNSELKEEVNTSVREICKHYGVKLVELHDIDKKGGHPSIAGMKAIADQLK
jgi:lysophospholipase L1-like esterase